MANRTVMGQRLSGQYGFYISKVGKEVLAITNPEDFLFSSDLAGAVIHASGTMTRGSTVSFAALPYVPIVLSWGILKSNGSQAGRFKYNQGRSESWWNPSMSEYEYEVFSNSHEGPILHATTSSVSYPVPFTNEFTIPDLWNARYLVLRTNGGA